MSITPSGPKISRSASVVRDPMPACRSALRLGLEQEGPARRQLVAEGLGREVEEEALAADRRLAAVVEVIGEDEPVAVAGEGRQDRRPFADRDRAVDDQGLALAVELDDPAPRSGPRRRPGSTRRSRGSRGRRSRPCSCRSAGPPGRPGRARPSRRWPRRAGASSAAGAGRRGGCGPGPPGGRAGRSGRRRRPCRPRPAGTGARRRPPEEPDAPDLRLPGDRALRTLRGEHAVPAPSSMTVEGETPIVSGGGTAAGPLPPAAGGRARGRAPSTSPGGRCGHSSRCGAPRSCPDPAPPRDGGRESALVTARRRGGGRGRGAFGVTPPAFL